MFSLKSSLLSGVIAAVCTSGCVTGGGAGEGASIAGAVLVFSQLATLAEKGDQNAKKSWCEAFALVSAHTLPGPDGQYPEEAALTEKLAPEMHNVMRKSGFAMHRQQLAIIIKDAYNVAKNQEASAAMRQSCLP
jgi:hypothetical protein